VDHSELVSLADKHFSNISLTHEYEIPEFKRCRFTGSEVICSCIIDSLVIVNCCWKLVALCIRTHSKQFVCDSKLDD